jgi:gliding motility-associated lipoprotein GldH
MLLAFTFAILFISCNDNNVYKKFDKDFTDNRWVKTDVRNYDFTIGKGGNYDLAIDFSHVYGSPFASIPIKIAIEYPDNNTDVNTIALLLADEQGNPISDCSGDFCDLEQAVFSGKKLNAGHYKVSLTNEFPNEFLPNVLGLGIKVSPSK